MREIQERYTEEEMVKFRKTTKVGRRRVRHGNAARKY